MAKKIQDVIEDRMEIGHDALRAWVKMAKASEHPSVVDMAEHADKAITNAFLSVEAVRKESQKVSGDAKAMGTKDDPRQDTLPGADGEDDDEGITD